MGSADWMPRNLDKRVEILFPVEDETLRQEVIHILDIQLRDNVKAHIMQSDGTYKKQDLRGRKKICAQDYFRQEAMDNTTKRKQEQKNNRTFEPMTKS
jgi:polyphosphate kinase